MTKEVERLKAENKKLRGIVERIAADDPTARRAIIPDARDVLASIGPPRTEKNSAS